MENNFFTQEGAEKSLPHKIIIPMIAIFIVIILFLIYVASMRSVKTDTLQFPIVKTNTFPNVAITAKSAVVWDIKEQRAIYEYNPDLVLPLASLAKIMMAVTANELAPNYTVIPIQKEFLAEEGDSGLVVNEKWRLKDLLDLSLMMSSNDGSRAIASVIGAISSGAENYDAGRKEFISRMNEGAKKIGMLNTTFLNDNGLDKSEYYGGAYGTAKDMARLFEYVLQTQPEIIDATKNGKIEIFSLNNVAHKVTNTNTSVESIPGIIASKTGFTNLAGGNLVVAFDPDLGRPFIISVLGSTVDGRFSDVEVLVNASRAYLNQQ